MAKTNRKNQYTFLDLAEEVLEKTGIPMTSSEIWQKGEEYGFDQKMNGRTTGTNSISSMSERMGYAVINRSETFIIAGRKASVTLYGLTKLIDDYKSKNYGAEYTIDIKKKILLRDYLVTAYSINNFNEYKFEFNRKNGVTNEARIKTWLNGVTEDKLNGAVPGISYWGWKGGKNGKKASAKYKVGEKCLSFVSVDKNKWLLVSAGVVIAIPSNSSAVVNILDELKPLFGKMIVECQIGETYVVKGTTIVDKCTVVQICDDLYKDDQELTQGFLEGVEGNNEESNSDGKEELCCPRNRIIFGAPGTGKSYKIKEESSVFGNAFERVTFHPDYYYSNFVGTYKPVMKDNGSGKEEISYEFVPGPFLRVYAKAMMPQKSNVLLIIEEINRATVAAVFGDVFQLLDRDKDGKSEYDVAASEDVKKWLKKQGVSEVENLSLPSNMYIWATMNSADQGVFPMDTAFKRRWSFEYLPLDDGETAVETIGAAGQGKSWNAFRKELNRVLMDELNINEDKCMGPFFLKKEEIEKWGEDDFDGIFKSKILMYLFEDAAKQKRGSLFANGLNTFSKICDAYKKQIVFKSDALNGLLPSKKVTVEETVETVEETVGEVVGEE